MLYWCSTPKLAFWRFKVLSSTPLTAIYLFMCNILDTLVIYNLKYNAQMQFMWFQLALASSAVHIALFIDFIAQLIRKWPTKSKFILIPIVLTLKKYNMKVWDMYCLKYLNNWSGLDIEHHVAHLLNGKQFEKFNHRFLLAVHKASA